MRPPNQQSSSDGSPPPARPHAAALLDWCDIAEDAPTPLWAISADRRTAVGNAAWREFLGPDNAVRAEPGWGAQVHPDDLPTASHVFEQAINTRRRFTIECRLRRADGEYRWIRSTATPRHTAQGSFEGFLGTSVDVTDAQRSRDDARTRALQQAAVAQLGLIALKSTDLLNLMDAAVRTVADTLDVEMCKVLELEPDRGSLLLRAGVGWHEGLVGRASVPSDIDSQAGFTLNSDGPVIVDDLPTETRFNGPNLLFDHGVVSGMSVIIEGTNGPYGVLGVHSTRHRWFSADDISFLQSIANVIATAMARRHSEELTRRQAWIIEQIGDAVITLDTEGRITSWNAGAEQLTGYAEREAIGRPLSFLLPAERRADFEASLMEPVHLGEAFRCDIPGQRRDDKRFLAECSLSPMHDAHNRTVGMIAYLTDVTQQRRIEEEFRQVQKMEAVGLLASGIAHDLNNLLTALFANLHTARRKLPEDHPAAADLDEIEAAATHASGVTRGLLAFGRPDEPGRITVDLNAVVNAATRLLKLPASVRLHVQTSGNGPAWVKADPIQLQQVLLNLAINARDAMPDGGSLRINIERGVPGDQASPARITVVDTGIGIQPADMHRLFEPFYTTKGRSHGTGLGLPISQSIVREHGGTITVASEVGVGSSFCIELPTAEDPPSPQNGRSQAASGRGEQVVLVEDNRHVREVLTSALRSAGYTVLPASTASEAHSILTDSDARVLITDNDLPDTEGVRLIEQLRARGDRRPAILISGRHHKNGNTPDEGDASYLNLPKPFQVNDLADLVRICIDRDQISSGKGDQP